MRFQADLLEQFLEGSAEAACELIELAASGDEAALDALRNIGDGGGPEADPGHPGHEEAWGSSFRDRLHRMMIEAESDPRAALPTVRKELLEPLGVCHRVLVLGIQAQIHRSLGNFSEAENALGVAWKLSRCCPAGRLEVLRRRGLLDAAQGRYSAGLARVEEALLGYRQLATPGHDLDANGIAVSLYTRGDIRHVMGDNAGASEDFSECLSAISPTTAPIFYGYAISALAVALSRIDRESQRKALPLVAVARRRFHGVRRRSVQRAHLDWLEGVLKWELRVLPLFRAVERLRRAVTDFAILGLPAQTIGAASDLFRIYSPNLGEIRDSLAVLRPRLDALDLSPLPAVVHRQLDRLYEAAASRSLNARKYVDHAVADLRRAISGAPGVIPCLLTR